MDLYIPVKINRRKRQQSGKPDCTGDEWYDEKCQNIGQASHVDFAFAEPVDNKQKNRVESVGSKKNQTAKSFGRCNRFGKGDFSEGAHDIYRKVSD